MKQGMDVEKQPLVSAMSLATTTIKGEWVMLAMWKGLSWGPGEPSMRKVAVGGGLSD